MSDPDHPRLLPTPVFADRRGAVLELHRAAFDPRDSIGPFVQDNLSHNAAGALRGLHYQLRHPQGKLICVAHGEIWDVVLDIRRGSPSFGVWSSFLLRAATGDRLWVPPGFAHGFCTTGGEAVVLYKCTDVWHPDDSFGVAWDDPALAIPWPIRAPILSDADRRWPALHDVPADHLPTFTPRAPA
jgi:dTDP-4-dehydrorhamnose 3,5-epimerase